MKQSNSSAVLKWLGRTPLDADTTPSLLVSSLAEEQMNRAAIKGLPRKTIAPLPLVHLYLFGGDEKIIRTWFSGVWERACRSISFIFISYKGIVAHSLLLLLGRNVLSLRIQDLL